MMLTGFFMFQSDLRLKLFGVKTQAHVFEDSGPARDPESRRFISYEFKINDGFVRSSADIRGDFPMPDDKMLDVYYPSDEPKDARLAMRINMKGWVIIFLVKRRHFGGHGARRDVWKINANRDF